jgi:hypothetical protein
MTIAFTFFINILNFFIILIIMSLLFKLIIYLFFNNIPTSFFLIVIISLTNLFLVVLIV